MSTDLMKELEENKMRFADSHPSVFAVETEYYVIVTVNTETTMWVDVGKKTYYDHSNGILRSGKFLHSVKVPIEDLDRAGKYTLNLREIKERKPYFTETGEVESKTYSFRPLKKGKEQIRLAHIADAHSHVVEPAMSAIYSQRGDIDLLILNGDLPNHSGDIEYFRGIYIMAGLVSKGEIPCVFSRGNHDLRGIYAEEFENYTPTYYGKSYYTFRLGDIFGIILDCGEDKPDDHEAYGHTICCHHFREEETRFIDEVMKKKEYEGYKYRLIISHVPFPHQQKPPFDIEKELYASWSKKLKKMKPTVMISGHLHQFVVSDPGSDFDTYGQPCPIIVGSELHDIDGKIVHCSAGITLSEKEIVAVDMSSEGELKGRFLISLK